jgi:alpha-galactosidase
VIPKLKELGLTWATLDDRFSMLRRLEPAGGYLPRGEEEMRAMVAALHEAGLYAQLWWYPLRWKTAWGNMTPIRTAYRRGEGAS